MRKLMAFGTTLCIGFAAISQISLQNTISTGFAFPISANNINSSRNGNAMHYGNHVDILAGQGGFRVGIGGFAGQVIGLSVGDYKNTAQELASKYRLPSDKFRFAESAFRSSAFLIGPVADWQRKNMNINLWAKGGYSLNEPGKFSATIQDAGAISNVYVSQAGSNKNSFACNLGGGLSYRINEILSLQLAASYFDTKTELVNFNYDREKGTAPLNFTAHNSFIQAVFGLHFGISGQRSTKTYQHQSDKDIVNNRYIVKSDGIVYDVKEQNNNSPLIDDDKRQIANDTIIFEPQSIELKEIASAFTGRQLQATNNYLTAFLYRTANGVEVSQCSGERRPGDPIPGLDVKLKNRNSGQVYPVHTNDDGSFSVRNMEDGIYQAMTNADTALFSIRNKTENGDYRLVEMETGSCGIKSNNIIYADGQMYAEVITAREAGSGMATGKILAPRDMATGQASGKRMHKPISVINQDLDLNYNNIVRIDGLLYAEVKTAREAGSGMATGKRTFIHGDLDGDGLNDRVSASQNPQTLRGFYSAPQVNDEVMTIEHDSDDDGVMEYYVLAPRDAASGQASGKRQHGSIRVIKEWGIDEGSNQQRDLASGQSSGKRQHGTVTIVKGRTADEDIFIVEENDTYDALEYDVKSPRDVATGQASGRMSRQDLNDLAAQTGNVYVIAPRDAASGQASGKRQHGSPIIIRNNANAFEYDIKAPRDVATGQASGKRTHHPLRWSNDPYSEDVMRMNYTVDGSKGDQMEFSVPLVLDAENASGWMLNKTYDIQPVTSAESLRATKSRSNIQNNRTATKTRSNIQNNRTMNDASDTAEPNYATINTTRSNIKGGKMNTASSGSADANYATVNTTRSNIKHNKMAGNIEVISIERIHCAAGNCTMEATVSIDGMEYDAVISGVLKTRHDTVKNSIGNIR